MKTNVDDSMLATTTTTTKRVARDIQPREDLGNTSHCLAQEDLPSTFRDVKHSFLQSGYEAITWGQTSGG